MRIDIIKHPAVTKGWLEDKRSFEFWEFIDSMIQDAQKILEASPSLIHIHQAQGTLRSLKRLRGLADELRDLKKGQ